MNQISKYIIFFLSGIAVVSILFYYTYSQTRQILREKFSVAFDQAILLDMEQRSEGVPMVFFSDSSATSDENHFTVETEQGKTVYEKSERHKSLTRSEKTSYALQSYLQMENPVRVSQLDSLFRTELENVGIVAPTVVSYTDNQTGITRHNDVSSSHAGNAFYATALSTERRTVGIFDEISLQGFVKVKPMTVCRHVPLPFILLLAAVTIAGLPVYVLLFRKGKTSLFSGETKPKGPFRLETFERAFSYPGGSVKLTGDMTFRLFACVWNGNNHFASYEDIALSLYGKGVDTGTGKRRMTQTVKTLRGQLKKCPVEIENVELQGYRIVCGANGSYVSRKFNKWKRRFREMIETQVSRQSA
jgi:hypothetical protein